MNKTFVCLELMNHMVLVAKEAKARGHRIVALNHDPLRDSGPFAVPDGLVDELLPIASWSDPAQVEPVIDDLLKRHEVGGTYAGFEATLPFEAALRERAGLPNNGADNVRRVMDKAAVRRKLYAEGLSELRSMSLREALKEDGWPLERPAVLKPANGTGSALCYLVSSPEELRAAADEIERATVVNPLMREYILTHGEFVLEERAEGELLSVESLVYRGEVHTMGLMGRYVLAKDPVVEMGFQFPYHHPRLQEIFAKAKRFHESMGIFHGPTQIEVMVPESGPIELIDFNARLAGTGSIVVFSEALGVPYQKLVTDLACGTEPDLSFLGGPTGFASEMLVLPPPGATVMNSLEFPAETICRRTMKEFGRPLSGRADQLDAIAMFVVSATSAAESHKKAIDARHNMTFNGQPLGENENNVLEFSNYIGKDLLPGK